MTKTLILFGDQTAAEMEAVAREVYSDHFDCITKCYVNSVDLTLTPDREIPQDSDSKIYYAIGVLEMNLKLRIEHMCSLRRYQPWTLIHPSAYVAESAQIGNGCFIAPFAAVAVNAVVGDHSIVHFHASVGHGVTLGRHCAILPGARISGKAVIGDGVMVGSNAFVYQGTRVGDGAKVDAMTYVKEDLPSGRVASVRRKFPG